jgi:hypothetical protein
MHFHGDGKIFFYVSDDCLIDCRGNIDGVQIAINLDKLGVVKICDATNVQESILRM